MKVLAKELKILFVETLANVKGFRYKEGNPFYMQIGPKPYFIFLKNISPAFFVNSPDITRVQLPYSKHFSKVLRAQVPFVILGYDSENDIFVSWNPNQIKDRLNTKSNVSLYSRKSIQSKVRGNGFKEAYLSNGDKIVLFKRSSLNEFFDSMVTLFRRSTELTKQITVTEPLEAFDDGMLRKITDREILHSLKPLLKESKVLEAVNVCSKYYDTQYPSMSFKDWFQLVNNLYKSGSW